MATALPPATRAFLAFQRFGLGARPGDLELARRDPMAAVRAELDDPASPLIAAEGLPTTRDAFRREAENQKAINAFRLNPPPPAGPPMAPAAPPQPAAGPASSPPKAPAPPASIASQIYLAEIAARCTAARAAPLGLSERLVAFWSNHFAISVDKGGPVRAMAGAFEREAIRPHVLGRFDEMLMAVAKHPAMLLYLDNAGSLGPASPAGVRTGRGLNENFAREILELHTLGVNGGYGQGDVTAFAKVLTGWTVRSGAAPDDLLGRFLFDRNRHEPGAQTLLGEAYPQTDLLQGEAVLSAIARTPATAQHLARKLAAHFVADDPPQALVQRLAERFLATGGDLRQLTIALVEAPEAWLPAPGKVRPPWDWLMASGRCLDAAPPVDLTLRALRALGQTPWEVPSPKGYPDDSVSWLSPDGLTVRLEVANELGRRFAPQDPDARAADVLGPAYEGELKQTVQRAESRPQAFALMTLSPAFIRR